MLKAKVKLLVSLFIKFSKKTDIVVTEIIIKKTLPTALTKVSFFKSFNTFFQNCQYPIFSQPT